MDRDTYSPNRREFIAGTVGVGSVGSGIESVAARSWAGYPRTDASSGTVDVVVRFDPGAGASAATLQRHARVTQRPFEEFATGRPGVSIQRQFWAANAALVSVDLGSVSRRSILDVDGVTTVHPNYAVDDTSTADETETAATDVSTSQPAEPDGPYHLEAMDVPRAWELYDTWGEGVDVAVIDTGIDTSDHDELVASLERGGWAEFDERGDRVDSDPNAQTEFPSAGHGTSVSGIIAGGTTDEGARFGIAPAVNLYKAKLVTQPPDGIRTLSVFAGIEWAIERDVDVLSMSLGLPQYNAAFVEPIRNAIESGILVVNSIGNSGRYTSVSAGNIPGVLSVGAVDDDRELYANSSGERIDTDRYWGDDAIAEWPETYTVPDVTAPGVDVVGPVLDGQFAQNTGTSFAAPCVAGVAALAIAATDADADAVRAAIEATARHPAAADDFDVDPGHDDRYGQGIVSALAAISRLEATESLTGTVTDASGTPLDGVTVASEAGPATETDAQGRFELAVPPGTQPVGATGIGFEKTTTRLDPTDTDTRAFQLDRTDSLDVALVDRMATRIDTGAAATATFDVANAESVVVERDADGLFEPGALELTVAGRQATFGEPVGIDSDRARITVGVAVPESVPIAQFRLSYEFAGGGASVTGEGRLVHAHPDPFVLDPADPPTLQTPIDLVAPRSTIELTDGRGDAVATADDDAGLVVDKPLTVTAADDATPTVQFANDGAERPAVALVTANDVTISGLAVEAGDAEIGIQVARERAVPRPVPHPSGVVIRDLAITGADTAVHAGQAPALRILENELTGGTTGITVGRRVAFQESETVTSRAKTIVRGNTVTDVEAGIVVAGQVAAIEGNVLSNVGTVGIRLGTPRFLSRHWGLDIGPIRANEITGADRGIVVAGVLTRALEGNTLSDIASTALVVDGAVLAPIRANRIDGAPTGLRIADDAEVASVTDNEFLNVDDPGDEAAVGETTETDTVTRDGTSETTTDSTSDQTANADTEAADRTDASDGAGPGFGVGSVLVSLASAGYVLHRRSSTDDGE